MGENILEKTVFNSDTEFSSRILVLMAEVREPLTLERILLYDFISCFPLTFGIQGNSVLGKNRFLFSEISLRREKIVSALRTLMFKGLVAVCLDVHSGFLYALTKEGLVLDKCLEDDYLNAYLDNLDQVIEKYSGYGDIELMMSVQKKSEEIEV